MILESLRPDAPVNIKNLVIESPRKPELDLPFDPKRDITEDDLRAMDEQAKADVKDPDLSWRAVATCADLKLLFPNRPLPVDFNSSENFRLVRKDFNKGLAKPAKILYPKKTILDFGKKARNYLDKKLQQETEGANKDFYSYSSFRVDLKLFYPEATQQLQADKEAVKNSLNEQIEMYRKDVRWRDLAETASNARIVLEDDFDLKLSAEDWQGMHKELEYLRESRYWYVVISLAEDMMILAAEKVRVTPSEGLVLTMPQPKLDFRQSIPPLPQMRRF